MASGKEAMRRKKKEQAKRAKAKVHHHRVKRDIITADTVIPDVNVALALLADIQAKRDLLVGVQPGFGTVDGDGGLPLCRGDRLVAISRGLVTPTLAIALGA